MALPENLLSLQGAADHLNRAVCRGSVRRWISKGVGRPPIKLRAWRIGRQFFTTPDAIDEFIEATTSADATQFENMKQSERVEAARQRLQPAGQAEEEGG